MLAARSDKNLELGWQTVIFFLLQMKRAAAQRLSSKEENISFLVGVGYETEPLYA